MTAHYFELGMPPIGECIQLSEKEPIPSEAEAQPSSLEADYPGVYILAACIGHWFSLYDRTRGGAWRQSEIRRVRLDPVGPGKGPGYILLCLECANVRFPVVVMSSAFSERVGVWMEEKAEAIAAKIGVPYECMPIGADA